MADRPTDDLLRRILAVVAAEAADERIEQLIAQARSEAESEIRELLKSAMKASLLRRTVERLESGAAPATPAPNRAEPPPVTEQRESNDVFPQVPRVQPTSETAAPGWYVYAIIPASPQDWAADLPGVDPRFPLQLLAYDNVQAVVSEVSLDEFGQGQIEQRVSDPQWIESKVRAHDEVVKRALEIGPVIPCRFCTVVRSREDVRRLLAEHQQGIAGTLASLQGKTEWGVKIYAQQAGQVKTLAGAAASDLSGKAYLQRKKRETGTRGELARTTRERAEEVHQQLATLSAEATVLPRRPWKGGGNRAEPIFNGAYLVADVDAERFHGAVTQLAEQTAAAAGLELELTGPWPPYNFVHLDLSLEAAA